MKRSLARASVSLLPDKVRARLELGREFDLTRRDRLALRMMGKLADRVRSKDSPAWQAAVRLGLPGDFACRAVFGDVAGAVAGATSKVGQGMSQGVVLSQTERKQAIHPLCSL